MNIIELDLFISELKKDKVGNKKLLVFYAKKRKELVAKITKNINSKL